MSDEHPDNLTDEEFPPLEEGEGAVFADEELEYTYDPGLGEVAIPEGQPEGDPGLESAAPTSVPVEPPYFVAPEQSFPITATGHEDSGGVLFLPDNDPLRIAPARPVPSPRPTQPPWVSKRLRHLVSEPKQSVYKDPSGRNRPRG